MTAKTLFPFLSLLLHFGCNNYGMLDKLENPGGTSSSPPPTYRIFVTTGTVAGNIGITGADTACQTDGLNPDTSRTWKAMLVGGTTRRACINANCSGSGILENHNWVLKPNATYVRPGGTLIGSTNDRALLIFPLSNSIGTSGAQPWTGLNTDWTTDDATNCSNWTTNAGDVSGRVGQANLTHSETIRVMTMARSCVSWGPLYCVEQ